METFADIVRARAGDPGTGLLFEGQSWAWGEVVQEAADRAAALAATVERPADRQVHVGVLLDNVPDFVFWVGGVALSGAVLVGINSSRSAAEIAHDIRHVGIDMVVTEDRLAHLLEGDHGVPATHVHNVDHPSYAEFLAPFRGAPVPDVVPAPEDIALLLFSSGSTGAPKAVIVGQGRLGKLLEAMVGRARLHRDSVTYLCMPLFHGNALMLNLGAAMSAGATVAMVRKFSASAFAPDIHRYGVTMVNYVGRALSYVLSRPELPEDRTSTLELAFGTEASEADVARFEERFGCEVMEGYGLSEGVLRINRTPDSPSGSLGLPVGGADVRIMDEATGLECPRATFDASGRLVDGAAVGQIVGVGLAHTFEGYWRNPGAMADRVKGDDFWTGDLGYRDEAGFFYFAGRSSDWLRVDSENFSAAPVERVLQRFPGVLAAPVFAVPDATTGDQVMCAVELAPGVTFDAAAFGTYLAQQPEMSAKWWPRYVRVIDKLPLTGSNKVNKAPLRAAAWCTSDPVWVRVGRTDDYVLLDDAQRDEIEKEFVEQGRQALLPAG